MDYSNKTMLYQARIRTISEQGDG